MARVLSTAFCVALLAATAIAFAFTEGAKTELSPIYQTKIPHVFSPTCNLHQQGCKTNVEDIDFTLRKKQHLRVWIEQNGTQVSTVVAGETFPKGPVKLEFTGIADDGVTILPDGIYYAVISLTSEHRVITLPNKIQLDTTAPQAITFRKQVYTHISPDGDHRQDVPRAGMRRRGPAGEPVEHHLALFFWDADAVVVDRDLPPARELTADNCTLLAPPCLTALAIALSTASRRPAGSPTMITVGAGTRDTSRSGYTRSRRVRRGRAIR